MKKTITARHIGKVVRETYEDHNIEKGEDCGSKL